MEKKPSKWRRTAPYWICGALLTAAFGVFALRLFQWQVKDSDTYLEIANATSLSTVSIDAARGEILDRDGNALASNKTAYKIVFEKPYMTDKNANATIHTLVELMEERKETWNDELPIQLDKNGNYEFEKNKEDAIAFLKGKSFLNVNEYTSAELCVKQLCDLYDVEQEQYSKEELLRLLSVRYNMTMETFSTTMPYTFADSISKDTVSIIEENSKSLPGVTVKVTTTRQYEDGTIAPHLLGTIGKLTKDEFETLEEKGYSYDDVVGKSGIEYAFESNLRGEDGIRSLELNSDGTVKNSTVTKEPVQGNTVYTTLDSNLQKVAAASLAKNVKAASANGKEMKEKHVGEDCVAGGVVVLKIEDFSILAAATYPTYDLGKYVENPDYYTKLLQDETNPLFNRAFNGAFKPGSVFKPCVASAALEEGIITEKSRVTCNHVYNYYAPSYTPTCMGYHGSLNVVSALSHSCNIFFYDVGRRLGIDSIDLYAKSYGLGTTTGVELGESEGILASPTYRVTNGGTWQPGDTIQAAIGESDNAFTPLQLAAYCATIANDGTRLKTHIVDKITDYTRKEIVSETKSETVETVGVSKNNLKIVQEGMREVCKTGTASTTFGSYGIAVAGKTGTAENVGHSDNTVFIGYAPYDNPEIAVAVVLEYGASGVYSTGVAKDIFDAYFYGKVLDEDGNLVTPGVAGSTEGIATGADAL